jgi:hypothetical protein
MAKLLKFRAQFGVIVDFAVEGDDHVAVAREHRLVAVAEIDNGKTRGAERNQIRLMKALLIGTAVMNGGQRAGDASARHGVVERGKSCDAAHKLSG